MEPADKPEPVLPQVFEYGPDQAARSTEYSDSHNLQTLTGTRTPSVEELELDGGALEPRKDQVWYGTSSVPRQMDRKLTSYIGECWERDRLM